MTVLSTNELVGKQREPLVSPEVHRFRSSNNKGAKLSAQQQEQVNWSNQQLPAQTELLILWAVNNSGEPGVYGLDIQRAIAECSNGSESISTGTLYSMLKRLRKKGFVDSSEGDPVAGGAKRQYYFLTDAGKSVVDYSIWLFNRLSEWKP